jgi:hypothetical protein
MQTPSAGAEKTQDQHPEPVSSLMVTSARDLPTVSERSGAELLVERGSRRPSWKRPTRAPQNVRRGDTPIEVVLGDNVDESVPDSDELDDELEKLTNDIQLEPAPDEARPQ